MMPYYMRPSGDEKSFCLRCEVASTETGCWICGGPTVFRAVFIINAYNHHASDDVSHEPLVECDG